MASTSATHPTLSIYDKEDNIEIVSQTKTIIKSQKTSNVEVDATWVLFKPYFLSKKNQYPLLGFWLLLSSMV